MTTAARWRAALGDEPTTQDKPWAPGRSTAGVGEAGGRRYRRHAEDAEERRGQIVERVTRSVGVFVWVLVGGVVVLVHVFVLFVFFLVDVGNAEAAFGWQVANEVDESPHLVVGERSFPRGHS